MCLCKVGEIMTHEEFKAAYDDILRHGWVTSTVASIRDKQKQREKEYNRDYYRKHSYKWNRNIGITDPATLETLRTAIDYNTKKSNNSPSSNASVAETKSRKLQRMIRDLGRAQGEHEQQLFKALFGKAAPIYNETIDQLKFKERVALASTLILSRRNVMLTEVKQSLRKMANEVIK